MPTIGEFLTEKNWTKMGADFYYPGNGYPHLHLRVTNAQKEIEDYPDLRTGNYISFFMLTYGGDQPNINLVTAPVDDIGDAIRASWGEPALTSVQYIINRITGRGVDT
ncbi:MAG TPA: hypothetical protein VNP72_10815 [Longimicrobium sp.]|nr:hypothetical protein [Longimicrobium sp.]